MDISKLADQLAFLMEADRLKNLYRQTYTSTDDLPPMPEGSNDAEHSFSLALFTAVLAEYSNEPIDVLKTIKTVLIHDIVEIDAGDTYCYDSAGNSTKAEREKAAADRLFALLPPNQEKEFRGLWEDFEAGETPEAKFAAAMDKIQPLLLNLHRNGLSWKEHGIRFGQVEKRAAGISGGSEVLYGHIYEKLLEARDRGILPD